ncbi:hypothetical protein FRC08_012953 [Ceratobasidium sp. 394]|nr:hypothetical protein FRC08_012953 [Ceratobasidium sp. 394]
MHLFFENIVPNLIRLWNGTFKELNQGSGSYQLSSEDWALIGRETAAATRTLPADFGSPLPDIAQDGYLYKAEAHAFWIQFIAPIVLKNRLPGKYYKHALLLREIIMLCIQYEITTEEIDDLDKMVKSWVSDYEKYYYQYTADRLPTCPLTIHALLHLTYYIRQTGPLWASWAFVMERFCGRLLPAVKNRVRPYEHLDYYIQRRAQMQAVSAIFGLPELVRSQAAKQRAERRVEISSRETAYDEFPDIVLGAPVRRNIPLDDTLINQMAGYFDPVYPGYSVKQ